MATNQGMGNNNLTREGQREFSLGVVGCGQFARTFARSIQPLIPHISLYFASRNLAKAEAYAREFHGQGAFGSYEEAARSDSLDALYICTPHFLHMEHAILAITNRKHVLIEKPMALSQEECQRIISAGRNYHVNVMIAENFRFMPAVRLCKELVIQGEIGKIRTIQIQQESSFRASKWRKEPEKNGGGVFIDAGIHKIDFLRYLLGEPEHVYAVSPDPWESTNPVEDGLLFVSKWRTGEVGLIYHSWTASQISTPHWISMSGSDGKIMFEIGNPELRIEQGSSCQSLNIPDDCNGILPMVQEFIDSINENRNPEMSGEEGMKDIQIITKAYESLASRTSISL